MDAPIGHRAPVVWRLLSLLIVVAGAAVVLVATRSAPAVTRDSVDYLSAASNLGRGEFFVVSYSTYNEPYPAELRLPAASVPLEHFPPLFPATIGVVAAVTPVDPQTAARVLNALLFGLLGLAAFHLVVRDTGSLLWGFVAAGAVVAPDLVQVHATVWSEPLLLVATLGALWWFPRIGDGSRRATVVFACCLVAASLARFAGLFLVALPIAGAVVARRTRAPFAPRSAILATAAPMVAVGAWLAVNSVRSASANRTFGNYPVSLAGVARAVRTTADRWLPDGRLMFPALLLLVAGVVFAFWPRRTSRATPSDDARHGALALPALCVGLAGSYLAFVLLSKKTFDAAIPFDIRILSPVHVLLIVGAVSVAARLGRRRRVAGGTLLLAFSLVVASSLRDSQQLVQRFADAAAFQSDAWRRSPILTYVRSVPEDAAVLSNGPDFLWLQTGRRVLTVPPRVFATRNELNKRYSDDLKEVRRVVRGRPTVFVHFAAIDSNVPPHRSFASALGLRLVRAFPDGAVYSSE